jgi:hypothetical protein
VLLRLSTFVTINDTSSSSYLFSADDVVEGEQLEILVTPNPVGQLETLYYEISGSAAAKFTTTRTSQVNTSTTNPFTVLMPGAALTNSTYDGAVLGTITVSRDNYVGEGGTSIDSFTFNVVDAAPTGLVLTPSDSTPDEGTTVTFTISGGSNVPPTLYYNVSSVKLVKLSTNASSGQNFIPLLNTSGLQAGMESNSLVVPGTITSVQSNGVYMTQNLTGSLSTGNIIDFAFESTFDDFVGVPYGSTTSSTFDIELATDGDFTNDVYTVQLLDAQYNGNVLASTNITIQDQSGTPLSVTINNTFVADEESSTTFVSAFAGIKFMPSGVIQLQGNVNNSNFWIPNGNWITGTFDPADYRMIATRSGYTGTPAISSGSYGTLLNLSTEQEFALAVTNPATTGKNTGYQEVEFVIYELNNPSNTTSVTIAFQVESNKLGEGGDVVER